MPGPPRIGPYAVTTPGPGPLGPGIDILRRGGGGEVQGPPVPPVRDIWTEMGLPNPGAGFIPGQAEFPYPPAGGKGGGLSPEAQLLQTAQALAEATGIPVGWWMAQLLGFDSPASSFFKGAGGGGGGGGGGGMSAEATAFREREIAIQEARAAADKAYQEGQTAVSQGQLDLARQQFGESTRQNEIANSLERERIAISGRQAGVQERGQRFQEIIQPAGLQIQGFGEQERALAGRAGVGQRAAETLAGLFGTAGQLGLGQGQLAFDMARNPRNAVAAFLMGQGASGAPGASMFAPQNILGIDPGMIRGLLGQAQAGAQQGMRFAQSPPSMDIGSILAGLATRLAGLGAPSAPPTVQPAAGGFRAGYQGGQAGVFDQQGKFTPNTGFGGK